jgi:hypothetical protein
MIYKVFLHHLGSERSICIESFTNLESALRVMARLNRTLAILGKNKPDSNTYYYVLAESFNPNDFLGSEAELPFAPDYTLL